MTADQIRALQERHDDGLLDAHGIIGRVSLSRDELSALCAMALGATPEQIAARLTDDVLLSFYNTLLYCSYPEAVQVLVAALTPSSTDQEPT